MLKHTLPDDIICKEEKQMSMEINSNYNHLKTDYTERVKEKQDSDRIENAKETDTGKAFERQDEYISS